MSVDRRYLSWGIFLILLGGIPLAVNQGWLDRSAVIDAWRLWPLVLIGAGIGLVLSRTPLAALGGLIVAGTFGVIFGGLLAAGISFGGFGCGAADGNATLVADQAGTFDGSSAVVRLELDCGDLTAGAVDGSSWRVVADSTKQEAPRIEPTSSGLTVRSPGDRDVVIIPFVEGVRQSWTVDLPRGLRLGLTVTLNAGSGNLALDGATLDRIDMTANAAGRTVLDLERAKEVGQIGLTVNASDVAIALPAAGTTGSITANAGSVKLCAPPGTGLRLTTGDGFAASNNFDQRGLVGAGNTWETPGYAAAAAKIDLLTTGNAASFELDPQGGCR